MGDLGARARGNCAVHRRARLCWKRLAGAGGSVACRSNGAGAFRCEDGASLVDDQRVQDRVGFLALLHHQLIWVGHNRDDMRSGGGRSAGGDGGQIGAVLRPSVYGDWCCERRTWREHRRGASQCKRSDVESLRGILTKLSGPVSAACGVSMVRLHWTAGAYQRISDSAEVGQNEQEARLTTVSRAS